MSIVRKAILVYSCNIPTPPPMLLCCVGAVLFLLLQSLPERGSPLLCLMCGIASTAALRHPC